MTRTFFASAVILAALAGDAHAATFTPAPLLPGVGVDVLDRAATREKMQRELFGDPWATAVIGHVDVYDRFPYLESRWYQIVSDASWNRLLAGEMEGRMGAWDGAGTSFGKLDAPRGLDVGPDGRVYVADSGNRRVLAFDVVTEYDSITLVPRYAIQGLARPYGVAHSDAGTPFDTSDDRLYVADAGASRVVAYDLHADGAVERASVGELGSGAGRFAGPMAVAVGRVDGRNDDIVYVADSHNRRIVKLQDTGDALAWRGSSPIDAEGVTGLGVDHFGQVYAASPAAGIRKMTADLEPLASMESDVVRPRAFAVPFVNTTDHVRGTTRRAGFGGAVAVEQWADHSGLKLVRFGVDVRDASVRTGNDLAAEFTLTDRAEVSADVLDPAGRVVASAPLGQLSSGTNRVAMPADALTMAAGDYTLRVNARSTYEGGEGAQALLPFTWNGPEAVPASLAIVATSPNPFAESTAIRFAIPASGARSTTVAVYDLAGRLVRELASGPRSAGSHTVTWDGRDSAGRRVAAGVYLTRVEADGETAVRKVVHLR